VCGFRTLKRKGRTVDKITVSIAEYYGTERIYITSEQAEAIRELTGKKTISRTNIDSLKKLGFSFDVKQTATI